MDDIVKEIVIKQENPDSVEIHEDAKNLLHYELKLYFDSNGKIEDFTNKVNKFKEAIERDILRR